MFTIIYQHEISLEHKADNTCTVQTWGKHLAQTPEALPQILEKGLSTSTSTSTNASIK